MDAYACRFGAMINTWRDLWGMGDFAFVYCELQYKCQLSVEFSFENAEMMENSP